MGRDRTKRERLDRLLPDPQGQPDGLVPTTKSYVDERGLTQYTYDLETGGGGGNVASVTGAAPISVDNTDPANPIVGHDASGVTPGSYTSANITVDADGHVTAAANGSSGGSGTVTSVGLALPADIFTVSGSPVTTSGTLTGTKVNQSAATVFAGPASGGAAAPTFRQLARGDIPGFLGGLSFRLGRTDGAVLLPGFQRVFLLPASYDGLSNWELVTFPGSTCSIDIQYRTFGSTRPTTANSIVGGVYPATSGGATATGTTASWTNTAPAMRNYIAIQVISNNLAREIIFEVDGRRI